MKSIFKVDDDVWCMLYGKGKVTEVYAEGIFCIKVDFKKGDDVYELYTADGRLQLEYHPTLGFTKVEIPKPKQIRYRWRAEEGEVYWYIDEFGGVHHALESLRAEETFRFKAGNYFKTVEEARESEIYMSFIREEE